jgi:hypothetical protein
MGIQSSDIELAGNTEMVVVFYRVVAWPGFCGYSLWNRSSINGECSRWEAGCQDA